MRQSILWHKQQQTFFSEEPVASPGVNEVLIEAHYSLISLGTEKLVITQSLSANTAKRMRVPYMQGEFDDQFTYGYSMTGIVKAGQSEYVGKPVHVMHPHQPWAVTQAESVFVLPDSIDLLKATLISNMETAVNAVWDAELSLGDRVIVLGYGIIGTLLCELIRSIPGIELHVVEAMPSRADDALQTGLHVISSIEELTSPCHIAFNTTANESGLQSAIDAVDVEGTVIELSWHGSRSVELCLGDSFHYDRKKIISSQVSRIPNSKYPRWNYRSRKELVIKLLENLDTQLIISKLIHYADADQFFLNLRAQQSTHRGIVIDYKET